MIFSFIASVFWVMVERLFPFSTCIISLFYIEFLICPILFFSMVWGMDPIFSSPNGYLFFPTLIKGPSLSLRFEVPPLSYTNFHMILPNSELLFHWSVSPLLLHRLLLAWKIGFYISILVASFLHSLFSRIHLLIFISEDFYVDNTSANNDIFPLRVFHNHLPLPCQTL